MPHPFERAASRHHRDRDVPPRSPSLGPYELRYDVRRGYDEPVQPEACSAEYEGVGYLGREAVRER